MLMTTGALLIVATGVYQPWTIVLVAIVPGLFKVIDVNCDARLQGLIPSQSRATIGSIKTFAGQIAMTSVLAVFGALAQATSYRTAFFACGVVLVGIALTFVVARRKISGPGLA
jgi:hypothetical protein